MLVSRTVFACVGLCLGLQLLGPATTAAAEPVALSVGRTQFLFLRKGATEAANFRSLNLGQIDHYVVLLVGTGQARLTVSDADETGDTIRVNGTIQTALTTTFDQTATSPDKVQQPVLITSLGVLMFDVQYTSISNTTPARYFYNLKF
ncbi:hypothetical protein GC163_14845 [bacterium]|nr:hypothetical protein [bacterium]